MQSVARDEPPPPAVNRRRQRCVHELDLDGLIVNTASKCGYTPHYQGLQELHERFGSRGLQLSRAGPPVWNFTQHLVGGDGRLLARWPTKVPPDDPRIIAALEAALPG